MPHTLANVVDLERHPLSSGDFRAQCKATLDRHGALVMRQFLRADAIESIRREGDTHQHLAYYTSNDHNIYLTTPDPNYPPEHPRNREVASSKGCITTDQIPRDSALHTLYYAEEFRAFLCAVLDEQALFEYADPLSSVNLHYASEGQELGWHFDNSSFAITLMIQRPQAGGVFEYVKNARDADAGEMNYDTAGKVLDGELEVETLAMDAGALVLFRGRNSMHRVTPTQGDITRMLVVLAYNTEPGVSLSESARMTFYGRLN
ncbi:MAG: 2OG-Fe(II) oxygenase [Pseudomonadota bacterium]